MCESPVECVSLNSLHFQQGFFCLFENSFESVFRDSKICIIVLKVIQCRQTEVCIWKKNLTSVS